MRGFIFTLLLGCSLSSWGQISKSLEEVSPSTNRLLRHYPLPPFDRGGDGYLLGFWVHYNNINHTNSSLNSSRLKFLENFVFGASIRGRKWELAFDGISNLIPEINSQDGWWLGYETQITYKIAPGEKILFRSANNTTQRGAKWYTENNLLYYYAPEKSGLLILSGGYTSRETSHLTPEEQLTNLYLHPIGSNSSLRDFRKQYLGIRNRINYFDNWDLSTLILYEYRTPQEEVSLLNQRHQTFITEVGLSYTFGRTNLHKDERFATSQYPITYYPRAYEGLELGLNFRIALEPWTSSTLWSNFSILSANIRGNYIIDENNIIDYQCTIGGFWGNKRIFSPDQWRLNQANSISRSPLSFYWQTLPLGFDGGRQWGVTMLNYYSNNKILLGRLLNSPRYTGIINEAIHFRYYSNYTHSHYLETGYSIGFGQLARVGIFGGRELGNLSHWQYRLSLSLPIFLLTSSWSERF